MERCPWCGSSPLYTQYHDNEWGVPTADDNRLFEFLLLEGAQAGLSWITILKKRENYRAAYHDFDAEKIARYNQRSVERLLQNPGIVRNRLKVNSSISNAKLFLDIQQQYGSFAHYLWGFLGDFNGGRPVTNHFSTMAEVPASTPLSDTIAREMKKRGFRFFGSTICYAFMQAVGMVNDHLTTCHRHQQCATIAEHFKTPIQESGELRSP